MSGPVFHPTVKAASAAAMRSTGSRSRVGMYAAFAGLVIVGLLLALASQSLSARYGGGAALALIIGVPAFLVFGVLSFRRCFARWQEFRRHLTWWHWLWLIMTASNFVFRTRDIETVSENPLDAAAVYRISLVGLTAFILVLRLVLKRPNWLSSLFRGLVGIVAIFALTCVLSTIWSVKPPWTFYKSMEYLVDISLLAIILAAVRSIESYDSLLDWTWIICGTLVAIAWIEAPIWPADALEGSGGYIAGPLQYRLSGVYPGLGFNMLGTYGAIMSTVAVCRLLPIAGRKFDRLWYAAVLLLGMITMVFAQTRSAIGGFIVGVLLALVFSRRIRLGIMLGAAGALVLAISGVSGKLTEFLARGQSADQLASLSGRVEWWTAAWEAFKLKPFTGYGAFASGMSVFPKLGVKEITPLHSDYVEVLVGLGIWGPLLIVAGLAGTWWFLLKFNAKVPGGSLEKQTLVEAIAILGVLTVRTAVMGVIMSQPPIQYFAILGYAEYLRRRYARTKAPVPEIVAAPQAHSKSLSLVEFR